MKKNFKLSDRISRIQPSATLAMTAKAAELKRNNQPVYNMSVGEPDFSTPLHIQAAGEAAIRNGFTIPSTGKRQTLSDHCATAKRYPFPFPWHPRARPGNRARSGRRRNGNNRP